MKSVDAMHNKNADTEDYNGGHDKNYDKAGQTADSFEAASDTSQAEEGSGSRSPTRGRFDAVRAQILGARSDKKSSANGRDGESGADDDKADQPADSENALGEGWSIVKGKRPQDSVNRTTYITKQV